MINLPVFYVCQISIHFFIIELQQIHLSTLWYYYTVHYITHNVIISQFRGHHEYEQILVSKYLLNASCIPEFIIITSPCEASLYPHMKWLTSPHMKSWIHFICKYWLHIQPTVGLNKQFTFCFCTTHILQSILL